MEVAVKMEALESDGSERTVMLGMSYSSVHYGDDHLRLFTCTGRFSMVCRDAETHKARPVNPLITSTPEEKLLLEIGECTSIHTCYPT